MRSLLALIGLTTAMACGGKVKVDGEPSGGSGGAGGAPSSSSSTTPSTATGPMPSTGTGPQPACDCFDACQKISGCVGEQIECEELCNGLPTEMWQCVCNLQGCALETCFGGTGGSGGSGMSCERCTEIQLSTVCERQLFDCQNDPQCSGLLDCHSDCDFQPECAGKCDQMFPDGVEGTYGLIQCVACTDCFRPCIDTPLIDYCPFK